MATYGLDIYGRALYGAAGTGAFFDCDPMVADQSAYGALQVSWATPYQTSGTVPPAWSRQRLVRNAWGVPDTEDDGWVILDEAAGAVSNSFLDNTVVPGQLYYYALFVASGITAYSATQVYQPGDYTVLSSVSYVCLAVNTLNVTPGTNSAIWAVTPVTAPWYRCGSGVVGLALADSGYRPMLYDLVPRPYKVATVETTASSIPVNDDLYAFTSVFGWGFDLMKSENDQLLRMNTILECSDRQLGLIAQQMGIDDRLPALPELRRSFVRDANSITRRAGSTAALAELVTDLTGWKTTATIGYNQLPNLDAGAFSSTIVKPWQPNVFYIEGAGNNNLGDCVSYNGQVYFAAQGTLSTPFFTGSVSGTGGTVARITDPMAGVNAGYVELTGASAGSTMTVQLTGGIFGPTFNVYVCLVLDPSGGQVSASVNGTLVAGWTQDLYAPTRRMGEPVYVGTYTSPTMPVTIVLTVTGKQAVSAGYNIFAAYGLLQSSTASAPQNYDIPPTGAVLSATYWNQANLLTFRDVATERNYLTDGQNIWSMIYADGAVNPRSDNTIIGSTNGSFGVFPMATSVLTTGSPGPAGALAYTTNVASTVGKVTMTTGAEVQALAWSTSTPYYAGQPALVGTTVYTARNYTVGDNPATSPNKWRRTSLTNGVLPEPSLLQTQGITLKQTPTWTPGATYAQGAEAQWRGVIYQAAQSVPQGAAPTGYTTDNTWWRWIGPARRQYTLSAYQYRTATGTGQFVRPRVDWYDQFGTLLGAADVYAAAASQVFDHFETDGAAYPQSTVATPPTGWSTPAAWQQGTGCPWVVTYGTWGNTDNVASPTGWNTPTGTTTLLEEMQAGRVLWFDRQWLYGGSAPLDTVYATFVSAPFDPSHTMEHGIYFRGGSAGYWLASRDRLTYTTLAYASGFLASATATLVATYSTPVTDGQRMKVNVTASAVNVFVRSGGSETLLASSTLTNFNGQTGYGLLERIRI